MNEKVEKRRALLINAAYYAIILAVFYLVVKKFFAILFPFLCAFVFAAVFHKPVEAINRKTRMPKGAVSALIAILLIALILGSFFLIGMEIVDKIKDFYQYIIDRLNGASPVQSFVDWLMNAINNIRIEPIRKVLAENVGSFVNRFSSASGVRYVAPTAAHTTVTAAAKTVSDGLVSAQGIAARVISSGVAGAKSASGSSSVLSISTIISVGGSVLKSTVGKIPSLLVSVLVTIIASVFMTSGFGDIKSFFRRQLSSSNAARLSKAYHLTWSTLGKMIKAYALIMLMTSLEVGVGLYILYLFRIFEGSGFLRPDWIVLIAIGTAIVDIIPVLGTGTVIIPWALIELFKGNIKMTVGLAVLYAIITVVRQTVEPRLVAGQVDLNPIVTIMAMYIGTKTLGIFGFFILPFSIILIKTYNDAGVIHLFKTAPAGSEPQSKSKAEGGKPGLLSKLRRKK